MSSTAAVTSSPSAPRRLLATALGTVLVSAGTPAFADAGSGAADAASSADADLDTRHPNELESVTVEGHALDEPASPKWPVSM